MNENENTRFVRYGAIFKHVLTAFVQMRVAGEQAIAPAENQQPAILRSPIYSANTVEDSTLPGDAWPAIAKTSCMH